MTTHRHRNVIRDELAAILAADAGVARDNRVYSNYTDAASAMLTKHDYRPPGITDTPAGRLCLEWHEAKTFAVDERNRRASASAARREAAIAARDALTNAPAGFVHIHVRDESTGKLFKLTVPEENAKQG